MRSTDQRIGAASSGTLHLDLPRARKNAGGSLNNPESILAFPTISLLHFFRSLEGPRGELSS